jgi:hypothetical protein
LLSKTHSNDELTSYDYDSVTNLLLFKPKMVGLRFACKKEMTVVGLCGHYTSCKVTAVIVPGLACKQDKIREYKKIYQRKRTDNPEVKTHVK